jgi:hypothetical protein
MEHIRVPCNYPYYHKFDTENTLAYWHIIGLSVILSKDVTHKSEANYSTPQIVLLPQIWHRKTL